MDAQITIAPCLVQTLRRAALSLYQYGAGQTEKAAERYLIAWDAAYEDAEQLVAVEKARDEWHTTSDYLDRIYSLIGLLGLLGVGFRCEPLTVPGEYAAAIAAVVDEAESDAREHLADQASEMEPELVRSAGMTIYGLSRLRSALPVTPLRIPTEVTA